MSKLITLYVFPFIKTETKIPYLYMPFSTNRKRMQIYKFLLGNMNDEQKFKLTGKICNEVGLHSSYNSIKFFLIYKHYEDFMKFLMQL